MNSFKRKLRKLFKERQIYHRADGVVHFIAMSSRTQIILATIFLVFIGWVGFTTVNVIFQEQIISSKDTDFRQMQTFYTTKLNETKKSYDDVISLNSFLQQHFDQTIKDIKNRHETLERVLVGMEKSNSSKAELIRQLKRSGIRNNFKNGRNTIIINTSGHEPTLRQSRINSLKQIVRKEISFNKNTSIYDPAYSIKKVLFDSYSQQLSLMARTEEKANKELIELQQLISLVGRFVGNKNIIKNNNNLNYNSTIGIGGPLVALGEENRVLDIFINQAERTASTLAKLDNITESLNYIPLGEPIIEKRHSTSNFGARIDPFTKRRTLHLGIDFTSKYAAPIRATASGVVSYSGVKGGFGNVIEIKHGNGLMTRYAHLSRRKVKVGQKVKINNIIGLLGSTGRSTGPHLHYEIRYYGRAINPIKFIGIGKHVYQT